MVAAAIVPPLSLRSQCAHWLWQSASPVPLVGANCVRPLAGDRTEAGDHRSPLRAATIKTLYLVRGFVQEGCGRAPAGAVLGGQPGAARLLARRFAASPGSSCGAYRSEREGSLSSPTPRLVAFRGGPISLGSSPVGTRVRFWDRDGDRGRGMRIAASPLGLLAMTCKQVSRCGCRSSTVIPRPARTLVVGIRPPVLTDLKPTLRAKSRALPGCASDIRLRAHMRAHMPRRPLGSSQ